MKSIAHNTANNSLFIEVVFGISNIHVSLNSSAQIELKSERDLANNREINRRLVVQLDCWMEAFCN